jgi:uncharacterized membrane protein
MKIGPILLAVALAAFGIEFFVFGNLSTLLPIAPAGHTHLLWSIVAGVLLLVCGASIGTNRMPSIGAQVAAGFLLLGLFFTHVIALMHNVRDPGPWTTAGELSALAGGALMVAGGAIYSRVGGFLVALCLIIVGVQHMLYAQFIAGLIPGWIPARLFLAYFVGAAFFAAALSIVIQIGTRVAGVLLAVMFLTWVVILHAPRVMNNVHTETEWTSLFVALAMGGISMMIAAGRS